MVARTSDEGSEFAAKPSDLPLAERRIAFTSFSELERLPETRWLWQGVLPADSLTMLWGEQKGGKSTLVAGLLGALETGQPFLGRETSPATAVWVSEEPEQALREKAHSLSLFGASSSIAGAAQLGGARWEDVINAATQEAFEKGHQLVVFDTFLGLAGLGAEEENDAGAVALRLKPLRMAAAQGLAIIFVHHTTKNGRNRPRGSGAFEGLVDWSLGYRRDGRSQRFSLSARGRYQANGTVRGELISTGDVWSFAACNSGTRSSTGEEVDADDLLWGALPTAEAAAASYAELADNTPLTIDQVERRLRHWHADHRASLCRCGEGTKSRPFRWYRIN